MGVIKKTPGIWDYLYDNPKVTRRLENIKRKINQHNSGKLKKLFEEFKPDVVACTQAYPCGMVAGYKETFNSDLPLIAVLTDYVPHSYWIYDKVDYFIAPSEDVGLRLNDKGIPEEKIKPFGIPFDPKFNEPRDKAEICRQLGLDPEEPIILIMGGSHGLGPINAVIKSLEKTKPAIQEIIVAGANKKLYNSLNKKINRFGKKVLLFGFIDNVDELMSISDLIITKPGGVTTAEVLAKNLPMIILKPIPGQEANNTMYLTEKGAAIKVEDPRDLCQVIEGLFANPEKLNQLSSSCAKIAKPNASMDIARLLLELPHG
jgi:processive 1,2-diacylglycerol beta-glucosyltransferase